MKASINRITILLAFVLPTLAIGQNFPAYLSSDSFQPQNHPKLAGKGQIPTKNSSFQQQAPVHPVCVFDEMNDLEGQQDPAFAKALEHFIESELPEISKGNPDKSVLEPLLTISVVVHIIHTGEPIGTGKNLSTAQVQAQIDVLNEDYAALNSQFYNTPSQWMGIAGFPNIQFCLANKKPDGTATDGIDRKQMTVTGTTWSNNNINSTIKPATNWDPTRYFNIYVLPIPGTTAQGGVVGFSNYPVSGQIGSNTDGVVIDYRWFGAPGFSQSGYRPLTHETGHYLGLPHPFNGNSCTLDDGIGDTPNVEVATRDLATLDCSASYPNGPASCGNEHLYVNYMDYVTENCYTSFTAGQVNVMRAVLNGTSMGFGYGSRHNLIVNAPNQCSIPFTDAGITRVVNPNNISCTTGQITPVVTLRNFGTSNLTSANIFYKINNGAAISKAWQGNLFAGGNEDVSLNPFTPVGGSYTLTVWTTMPNGLADQRISNDTTIVNRFTYIAGAPPMAENFEGETGFPTAEGIFQLNVTNDAFVWQTTDEASGFGQGGTSVVFDNFHDINGANPGNTLDALITKHFDFTNLTQATLKFDVAYAPYIEDIGDSLIVLVATDCSQNFNQVVYRKGGMNLSTAPITTDAFTPTATQWRTEIVDLSDYDGMSDVTIALVNKSAFGNRLFIDNIGLGKSCNLLTASTTNISADDCSANCTGAATIQAASPNGGLHYAWEGFPNSFDQATNNQLCAGATTVTVTDFIGCSAQVAVNIFEQQSPQISTSSTEVTTYNGSDGTASVTVSSGTGPYSIQWSNGVQQTLLNNSTMTVSVLPVGNYSVTVTAANGCSSVSEVTVSSVCAGFTSNVILGNQPCSGSSNGSVMAQTQGGEAPFDFDWNNSMSTQTITSLQAGNYTVTITDANGCPSTASITLNSFPAINLSITPTHQTIQGMNDGAVSANVAGGGGSFTYNWSNNGTESSISGLAPGNYSLTVTDGNGCTASASVTINPVNCSAFSANLDITNLDCFGENDGAVSVLPAGGNSPFSYQWSNGSTASSITNLSAGAISVSISDAIGCVVELSGTVTQPSQLLANAIAINETIPDANDGSASLNPTGGTGPYTVLWSNGATQFSIANLAPGNYSYTVTDSKGCTVNGQVSIVESTCFIGLDFAATPTACPDFADGTASVSILSGGNGPFTYLWSNGETIANIAGLVAQTYTVTVTDNKGCSAIGQVEVSSNDVTPPTVVPKTNPTITLGQNGTTTIEPSDLVETATDNCSMVFFTVSPTAVDCSALGPIQVAVTGSDNSGNEAVVTFNATVQDNLPPTITCPPNIQLFGCESIDYALPTAIDNCTDASTISLNLVSGLNSGEQFPVGETVVTWSATDQSQNTSTCSFLVTVNYDFTVDALATSPSCHGNADGKIELNVTGGQPPYLIDLMPDANPNSLPAGIYEVEVTDSLGCVISQTIELTDPDELLVQFNGTTPATIGQSNGTIDFTVSGGTAPYTVSWLKNGVTQTGFDPQAVAAGSYQIKVEDANGCLLLSGLVTVQAVSSSHDRILEENITIVPNPTTGGFKVILDVLPPDFQVSIFDATGKSIVKAPEFNGSVTNFDLENVPSGVYWVKIVAGDAVAWKKVLKI